MHRNDKGAVRRWVSSVFLITLFAAALAPQPARGEIYDGISEGPAPGPGTRYLECRAESWANYNTCLVNATKESEKKACDMAWDLDNIGCDLELAGAMLGGFLGKLLGIAK
jgi:hypothetical protein